MVASVRSCFSQCSWPVFPDVAVEPWPALPALTWLALHDVDGVAVVAVVAVARGFQLRDGQ